MSLLIIAEYTWLIAFMYIAVFGAKMSLIIGTRHKRGCAVFSSLCILALLAAPVLLIGSPIYGAIVCYGFGLLFIATPFLIPCAIERFNCPPGKYIRKLLFVAISLLLLASGTYLLGI